MTDVALARRLLPGAHHRLVRTVDAMTDADFHAPSLLPGWSRAHVVAHLALNAEGMAAALLGIVAGEPVPMYASEEARDGDVDDLSGAAPAQLRDRLLGSISALGRALPALTEEQGGARVDRTPGGRSWPAALAPVLRLREVEVHHADLALGYGPRDWPPEFAAELVAGLAAGLDWERDFQLLARDEGLSWQVGAGAPPTVSGDLADLAWWICGRGDGHTLLVDDAELPEVPRW